MLSNAPFGFDLLRKYMSLFGALFSDIQITRSISNTETQAITVPLSFANKEKMLVRDEQDPNLDRQAAITLPRMSYEIVSIAYDGDRKGVSTNRRAIMTADPNSMSYQFSPVPYNIRLKLYVYVKNMSDGTKIVEQILPFFEPEYTVTCNLIPEMGVTVDVPIIYDGIELENTTSEVFSDKQVIIWTLNFTLKAALYGPVRTQKIIKFIESNVYLADDNSEVFTMTTEPGLDANGNPTTLVANSIPQANIKATDNFGIITIMSDL